MLALYALLPLLGLAQAAPAALHKRYNGVKIKSGRDGKCLAVVPKPVVGSAVVTVGCDEANYPMLWNINPGSGSIILSGTDGPNGPALALDAGSTPQNHGSLKAWQSYPGLFQQTWYYTGDFRIAITGGDQCLDEGDNGPQTYRCTTGNGNQVWYVDGPTTTTPPSSGGSGGGGSTPSPTDPLPDYPQSTDIVSDAGSGGNRIRVGGRPDYCVTVQNGFAGLGTNVAISHCTSNDDTFVEEEIWDLPDGQGNIRLHAKPYLCLDAGDNPGDGSQGMKLYTCYDGLLQQTWKFADGQLQLPNGQCLDIRKESTPSYQKPYNYIKSLQTWSCSATDPYQKFEVYTG